MVGKHIREERFATVAFAFGDNFSNELYPKLFWPNCRMRNVWELWAVPARAILYEQIFLMGVEMYSIPLLNFAPLFILSIKAHGKMAT